MEISEEWVFAHAPSPAVAGSAKLLSEAGRYSERYRSPEGRTWWAECAGSAVNRYHVALDCSGDEPLYTCSCPSRHFPCKHAVGLMFEVLSDKEFEVGEVPAYVLRIRDRWQQERARSQARLTRAREYDAAVRGKKLERQMDCLARAERLALELTERGLASLSDLPSQTVERLGAECGNCDLVGVRSRLGRLAVLERLSRQEEGGRHLAAAARELAALYALCRRGRAFLGEQLSSASYALEKPILFEELGGVWNRDELRELDSLRKHARLLQLSFGVRYDETRRCAVERGFWVELGRGDVVQTLDYRPGKPGQSAAGGDSCFDTLELPLLYEAPSASCHRVWWDEAAALPAEESDYRTALESARRDLGELLGSARTQLGEPLMGDFVPALVQVGAWGRVKGQPMLEGADGARVALGDREGFAAVRTLEALARPPQKGDALFGLLFYDGERRRLCLQPCSLVTADGIVRLEF